MSESQKILGVIAHFDGPKELLKAARAIRQKGYEKFDCHSPFPIHGMDEAMELKTSPVGWISGVFALTGIAVAVGLQFWTNSVDYPIVISGKPTFPWPAFVPITFELAVLFAAIGAVFGMLALAKLPKLYNALFHSSSLGRFSDDGFVVSIEAEDKQFDLDSIRSFLESLGGKNLEEVREP